MKINKQILIISCLAIIMVIGYLLINLLLVSYHSKVDSSNLRKIASSPTVTPLSFSPEQLATYYKSYQDPYVIHIRTALNGYLDGSDTGIDSPNLVIESTKTAVLISGLSSFSKDYYKSKFIVMAINPALSGGENISIIFQDKPDKLFDVWVYKLAGGAFDLRSFGQDTSYTPEKMANLQIEYKEALSDKQHSL